MKDFDNELLENIRDVEYQQEQFYTDKAKRIDTPDVKHFFTQLAREEHQYYALMDNLCDILANNNTYYEDLEFSPNSSHTIKIHQTRITKDFKTDYWKL